MVKFSTFCKYHENHSLGKFWTLNSFLALKNTLDSLNTNFGEILKNSTFLRYTPLEPKIVILASLYSRQQKSKFSKNLFRMRSRLYLLADSRIAQ